MEESIKELGSQLKRTRGVGLFYYAGHGMQIAGVNYLLPVNTRIEKESDVRFQSVSADMVLAEMENAENGLNIVILDACRDNPYSRSFRNAARGLAIVSNAPAGTFISYSTGANQVARDGEGKYSPYTRALLENMNKPGLSINNVFMRVRSEVKKETGQIPWELSSLEGDFYFVPGSPEQSASTLLSGKATVKMQESSVSTKAATDYLDDENRKLEVELRRLEEERASFAKQKALEEKRRKIVEERERLAAEQEAERLAAEERKQPKKTTTLAMAKRPFPATGGEIARDGRFIAYDNGTVLDTSTNLMWAAKDNGADIQWFKAKSYCENYRGGGYTDWRMPTQDELAALYDADKTSKNPVTEGCGGGYHLTELIHLTCGYLWSSEVVEYLSSTRIGGRQGASISFSMGNRNWSVTSIDGYHRALPVRSGK
jgi:hypothetical protein